MLTLQGKFINFVLLPSFFVVCFYFLCVGRSVQGFITYVFVSVFLFIFFFCLFICFRLFISCFFCLIGRVNNADAVTLTDIFKPPTTFTTSGGVNNVVTRTFAYTGGRTMITFGNSYFDGNIYIYIYMNILLLLYCFLFC